MDRKYLDLMDIKAYRISFDLSNYVWDVVLKWDYFSRDTVGKQYVKSIDSISANIAEGFGRYHKKEKVHFYRYSFGSIKESMDWTLKSKKRNLFSEDNYNYIFDKLDQLPKEIHSLIKFTNEKLKE
ncbi:MAG: four helix bundle protein [Bacteroidales bacterium]|nr:four helix bundle protein [Bacteroidales bacterium]